MKYIIFFFLSIFLGAGNPGWAKRNFALEEVDHKEHQSPEGHQRTVATGSTDTKEVLPSTSRTKRVKGSAKKVVWTSLPQVKQSKVAIGDSDDHWVEVGVVPSLERNSKLNTKIKDSRGTSIKARSAKMIKGKKTKKKRFKDLKKEGVLESSTVVELSTDGDEETGEEEKVDEEELEKRLKEALKKKKLAAR